MGKNMSCDLLLQHRVELKYKSKKVDTILNRLHVAEPVARDNKERPAFIPEAALKKQRQKLEQKMDEDDDDMETSVPKRKTEREIELEEGDDYIVDLKKNYDLANPDHKYDIIPETWQGHNIADFIDPDIMKKLEALEAEEEARERAGFYDSEEEEEDESYEEIKELAKKRERSVSRLKREFETLGVTGLAEDDEDAHFNRARSVSKSKPKRQKLGDDPHRSKSVVPRNKSGLRDPEGDGSKLHELKKKQDKKKFAKFGKAGESDRKILDKMPKHLFAGKRGLGKNERR